MTPKTRACLITWVLACLTTAAAAEYPLPHRHTIQADGHPIAIWEKSAAGAEQAILLVHGRTWSALPDFDLQVPGENLSLMDGLVEHGYRVYAVDLRGYGATERDSTGWLTPGRAADDVAIVMGWIAQQGSRPSKPHLFGWSMGSTVAQLSVQRYPDIAASLTLFGYWRDDDAVLPVDEPGPQPARTANTAQAAASDFITPGSISRKAIEAYVTTALAADPVRMDVTKTHQYNDLDASRIKIPTLIIAGEHDPLAPPEQLAKLFLRLGTSHKQYVSVPGGDHAAFLEESRDYFIHALVAFLRGVYL